jgi:hypothetical protein
MIHFRKLLWSSASVQPSYRPVTASTGAPIILGRCSSLPAHETVFATNLSRLQRETSKRHVVKAHSVRTTAILLPQCLSCCWGRIVSLRMLTILRFVDLRLATAQQRYTGQNLPPDLYTVYVCLRAHSLLSYFLLGNIPWHNHISSMRSVLEDVYLFCSHWQSSFPRLLQVSVCLQTSALTV